MRRAYGYTKESGFTIVELVAVIVITGIIAAIAAPRFIGVDAFDARGSFGSLASALRYAQKTAIAQRTTVCINVNTATKVVTLSYRNSADCSLASSGAVIDPSTQAAYSKTLSNNVTITAPVSTIGFDGLGRPVPNAMATFTVKNAVVPTESTRTITVEADTGYVR
jgi:MSHA pilin protein MshC